MIAGIDAAVQQMVVGERAMFHVPAELAYGRFVQPANSVRSTATIDIVMPAQMMG